MRLTTDYADTSKVKENSFEVLLDLLASGLDPERCTFFCSLMCRNMRSLSAVFHDYASGLAGACADVQRSAG